MVDHGAATIATHRVPFLRVLTRQRRRERTIPAAAVTECGTLAASKLCGGVLFDLVEGFQHVGQDVQRGVELTVGNVTLDAAHESMLSGGDGLDSVASVGNEAYQRGASVCRVRDEVDETRLAGIDDHALHELAAELLSAGYLRYCQLALSAEHYMRQMFSTSLEAAISAEAVILALDVDGEPMGVSIWLPHTTTAEEQETLPSVDENDLLARRMATAEAAASARRPTVAHLKLASMAALPEHRGKGAGSTMLCAGLERARTLGLPVYLEASTSDNRRLYARSGFRDLGETIDLPEGGPSLQPMWLDA